MSYTHLTAKERYFIYHMKLAGWSRGKIGRTIGRSPSTIRREIRRNGDHEGHYLDDVAQRKAAERRLSAAHRPVTGDTSLMAKSLCAV